MGIALSNGRPNARRFVLNAVLARARTTAALVAALVLTLAIRAPALARDAPGSAKPDLQSAAVLVVDESGRPLYAKHSQDQKPIASITKLMTAMVVLDAGVSLAEPITIIEADRDLLRHSRSRLRIDRSPTLPRGEMMAVALMSSDNRAASALGRTALPGGKPAFVAAMNRKAQSLGMTDSRFADPTGLDGGNRSTAEDLAIMVRAAVQYPVIRSITSRASIVVSPYRDGGKLEYRNTNPLVKDSGWNVELSKTGFVNEAGHCLVMRAVIAGRRVDIVLLDSAGKRSPFGDSNRLRKWLESNAPGQAGRVASSRWEDWE